MNKVAFITSVTPFGSQETFILTELLALKRVGVEMIVIPRDLSGEIFHKKAEKLIEKTLCVPWLDINIMKIFMTFCLLHPLIFIRLVYRICFRARNLKIALKNAVMLPKAIYLSEILLQESVCHIHAHWASTTATMAFIISQVTGIPWSFTAHRWDIKENNILREKCKTAEFVRAISERGKKEIIEIIDNENVSQKIIVIHMGVDIPEKDGGPGRASDMFTIMCPANLLPVKGHRYLLDACRILADKGLKFSCLIAGDGPLEKDLKQFATNLKLDQSVEFMGRLSHQAIFELYDTGKIDAVVLPSIITDDGENEGIPVALIEAMSYGIPVISTGTGSIPELLGDGSGLTANQRDPEALAFSIERLMKDKHLYVQISGKGKDKIREEFSLDYTAEKLQKLFSANCDG